MTIKDVAAYCGVSVSTVSRVLNNHPDVSATARLKVMRAVEKLHYTPNSAARDLVRTQVKAIGLVIRGISNPFFSPIIREIEQETERAGYALVLHQISTLSDEVKAGVELALSKRLDGLIFLGGRYDYTKDEIASIPVPFVCCTYTNHYGNLDRNDFSSVAINDKEEAARATQILLERGHRRIAILLDSKDDHSISERRYRGYSYAMGQAGLEVDPRLVIEAGDFSLDSAYRATHAFLSKNSDVTAIFGVADTMAIAAMKAASDFGLAIPKDLSLIAIDGIDLSKYTIPTLTTLCQPDQRLGNEAVRILLDILEHAHGNRHIRLETTLRSGGTVRSL